MSQLQLSRFVSPATQPLDDMHTHLSYVSIAYRDANTKLQNHTDRLVVGQQGFQGSGANTFSSLVAYYTETVERYCTALDDGANASRSCSMQVNNAVDSAACKSLDATIVTYVLGQVTLDDIILQGRSAIDPIMQDLQNTCTQMQNTCNDLQKTLAHEDALMNDANQAANQEWTDLSSFNFGAAGSDVGRYWGDQWQKLNSWGHEAGDYVQLGADGLHIAWDAIQITWLALAQWAEDIFQAVKNCQSFISSIVTTATKDINAFMGKLGSIIQEVIKDAQAALLDAEQGDDLGALAALADMLVNPERMLDGLQPLSQGQMEEIIIEKAPWLREIFTSLPLWAKIAIVVLVIAGLGFLAKFVLPGSGSKPSPAIDDFKKQTNQAWEKSTEKDRDNKNWGGGTLDLPGMSQVNSGFRTSPDDRYPGQHVEEQVVNWAITQIKAYRAVHDNKPLSSVVLNIYTFIAPCTKGNNCSSNLAPNGAWEKAIRKAAGLGDSDKDKAKIQIIVWTSNGQHGKKPPIKSWNRG